MDDKKLEELRAQRQLILKHLDWLDRQIVSAENRDVESNEPPKNANSNNTEELAAAKQQEDILDLSIQDNGEDSEIPKNTNPPLTDESEREAIEEKIRSYAGQPKNDIQRAKVGCLLIFVGAISLFLFLLFGLPYLLD